MWPVVSTAGDLLARPVSGEERRRRRCVERTFAFEPAPAEFASLERNVALNALQQVRLIAAAASDVNGEVAFSYSAERPTQGKLRDVEPAYDAGRAPTLAVRALRLDDMLKEEPPPDFIKIDVEGGAGRVLRGAARILDEVGPDVYLELHGPDERAFGGFSGLDGRAVLASYEHSLACIQRQAALRFSFLEAVTPIAIVREDRPDLALEERRILW